MSNSIKKFMRSSLEVGTGIGETLEDAIESILGGVGLLICGSAACVTGVIKGCFTSVAKGIESENVFEHLNTNNQDGSPDENRPQNSTTIMITQPNNIDKVDDPIAPGGSSVSSNNNGRSFFSSSTAISERSLVTNDLEEAEQEMLSL